MDRSIWMRVSQRKSYHKEKTLVIETCTIESLAFKNRHLNDAWVDQRKDYWNVEAGWKGAHICRCSQMFADLLQNGYSEKFSKFHKKTPVLESLNNKVSGLIQHRRFHVKFEKYLRTLFFQNTSGSCFCMYADFNFNPHQKKIIFTAPCSHLSIHSLLIYFIYLQLVQLNQAACCSQFTIILLARIPLIKILAQILVDISRFNF